MLKRPHLNLNMQGEVKLSRKGTDIKDIYEQFRSDGVDFVHGSNSSSLQGVALFRALLPMELINGTAWFHGHGLASGERYFSYNALFKDPKTFRLCPLSIRSRMEWFKDASGRWHMHEFPVFRKHVDVAAKGVSVNATANFNDSLFYSGLNTGKETEIFPILYGMKLDRTDLHFSHPVSGETLPHPITREAISIDKIRAIYVPDKRVAEVRSQLELRGLIRLGKAVKVGLCFQMT
ncbi:MULTISPECIES: hypothetical protein [unclassified Chelatococcus]|uniref:hypothetical protein n=1 Tax=unclassified Chelatococcus TaxID=2638111 RepID=UPI001BCC3696|nr:MULTISPECIES: hypothetical protein [unclassified Chelatococcus]MBS7697880.1 hypothetical protein [Chelatococcus sp. YT9]MBX3558543.1 hypothetical protein [Chelatococcus sp.]